MPKGGRSRGVVVSIQATGMEQAPWDGHLTTGVLANADTVVVSSPPRELLDAARGFEALVIPVSRGVDEPIERIRIAGVDAVQGPDDQGVTSLFLRLAHGSRYPAMIRSFDGCALAKELAAHGDLGVALINLGAVTATAFDGPSPELLRAVPDIELEQRRRLIQLHRTTDSDIDRWNPCAFIVWPCQPCRP